MTCLRLGSYPTPVERVEIAAGGEIWIKRDDKTGALYGGNKVRKLEHLLGAARDAGKTRIVTIGAVGSHQVVATALYGEANGFETEAVLVAQPRSAHAELNLRVALAHGLRATPAAAWSLAPVVAYSRMGRDAYFVPLGGSNALGALGFVDAGRELASQIARGEMPEPDVIVVALGSGGTAAGLSVGLQDAGLAARVVGVAVSHPAPALAFLARRLAKRTAALAGLSLDTGARAAKRIDVARAYVGRGYGHPTEEGRAASAKALAAGYTLDPTYTAKAFACALALAQQTPSRRILYWHTLSAAPLSAPPSDLPPELADLLR